MVTVISPLSTEYPLVARACPDLSALDDAVIQCCACPRLVAWREYVAAHPAPGYTSADYWSKPLPGFGDPHAPIMVIGLAPGAHGSNRTGRMFTGDKSGDYLFGSLHRVGLASAPVAVSADDGLRLTSVRLTAPVRCVPPENKPTALERRRCGPFLARELELVKPRVVVVLGGFGWHAVCQTLAEQGWPMPKPKPKFSHGALVELIQAAGGLNITLLGCYHPSPHNTYTGRLTPEMLDAVFTQAKLLAQLA